MSQLKLAACSKRRSVIKVGSVSVKVYATPTGRYPAHTLVYYFAGKRKRQKFASRSEALSAAEQIATRLSNGDTAVMSMSAADQASFARCQELARADGSDMPIEIALGSFFDLRRKLKGVPPDLAIEFYLKHHSGELSPQNVPELVQAFLGSKRRQNLSGVHLQDLQTRCDRFAESFQCPLIAVTRNDFDGWLQGLKDKRTGEKLGPRSCNNYRAAVLNLVSYAQTFKQVPKDWDELISIPPAKAGRGKIEIWTPAEMRLLLEGASAGLDAGKLDFDLVPYLAIGGFAGPRQSELRQLDWSKNVKLQIDYIMLGSEMTKTDKGRKTPILPNLAKWLRPYQGCHGPICRYRNVSNALVKLGRYVGLEWRHNALRHSFITYRVAMTNDVPATALEAGNSVQEIHDSYLEFSITADEAKDWFNLVPLDAGQKVLALNFTGQA